MRTALHGFLRLFTVLVPSSMRRQRELWVEPGNRITRAIWASLPHVETIPVPDVEYHMGVGQGRIMRPTPEPEAQEKASSSNATDVAA